MPILFTLYAPIVLFRGLGTLTSRGLRFAGVEGAVGNLLIFCVGWNLIHVEKKIRVANLLPSLIIAILWAFATST